MVNKYGGISVGNKKEKQVLVNKNGRNIRLKIMVAEINGK